MDPEHQHPPVIQHQNPRHYFSTSYRKKNRRQADALLSAGLLLIGLGSVMFPILYHGRLGIGIGTESQNFAFLTVFFVGNIIGTPTAAFLLGKFSKKMIYYVCCVLIILAGILKMAKGQYPGLDLDAINTFMSVQTAANFFAGVSFGICLLTSVIYAGEIAVRHLRGAVVHNIQLYFDLGIFIGIEIYAIILNMALSNKELITLTQHQGTGLTMILAGIITFITTYFLVIESPEFLLKNGDESGARENLLKLRRAPMETLEIIKDLDDMKQSLRESDMRSSSNFIGQFVQVDDLIPLARVFLLRFVFLMGTGLPLNKLMLDYVFLFIRTTHSGVVLIWLKLIGIMIAMFTVDRFGRKPILQISLVLSGILAIVINAIYMTQRDDITSAIDSDTSKLLGGLALIYQLALGFGAGIPYTYMSESFELSRKIYLCAIIFIAESLIQIFICVTTDPAEFEADAFIFFTGVLQILIAAGIFKFLPETTCTSLREAKNKMY